MFFSIHVRYFHSAGIGPGGTRPLDALTARPAKQTRPEVGFHLGTAAFTLLELLTVIAIIAVLVSLGFGAARRAGEAGRVARAQAELIMLAAALENYERALGDFPRTDDPAILLQALLGRRGPLGAVIHSRPYLEIGRFTIGGDRDPFSDASAMLLDPWGQPYRYAYQVSSPWRNSRFVLYSAGADGRDVATLRPGGFADATLPENSDNLYADRP